MRRRPAANRIKERDRHGCYVAVEARNPSRMVRATERGRSLASADGVILRGTDRLAAASTCYYPQRAVQQNAPRSRLEFRVRVARAEHARSAMRFREKGWVRF